MKKKKYTVRVSFNWRGHWYQSNQTLDLLDCEAENLRRAGKLEVHTRKTKSSHKKGA